MLQISFKSKFSKKITIQMFLKYRILNYRYLDINIEKISLQLKFVHLRSFISLFLKILIGVFSSSHGRIEFLDTEKVHVLEFCSL